MVFPSFSTLLQLSFIDCFAKKDANFAVCPSIASFKDNLRFVPCPITSAGKKKKVCELPQFSYRITRLNGLKMPACFLGCTESKSQEEKCGNCDIIACSEECMRIHKPLNQRKFVSNKKILQITLKGRGNIFKKTKSEIMRTKYKIIH